MLQALNSPSASFCAIESRSKFQGSACLPMYEASLPALTKEASCPRSASSLKIAAGYQCSQKTSISEWPRRQRSPPGEVWPTASRRAPRGGIRLPRGVTGFPTRDHGRLASVCDGHRLPPPNPSPENKAETERNESTEIVLGRPGKSDPKPDPRPEQRARVEGEIDSKEERRKCFATQESTPEPALLARVQAALRTPSRMGVRLGLVQPSNFVEGAKVFG
jgi:hypothetical protein